MIIKFIHACTPSQRQYSLRDFSNLCNKKVEKNLLKISFRKSAGHNNQGIITCRHKGGGHKRRYRLIDFKRNKYNIYGRVMSIEYDPNRTSHIALINYLDGEKRYILHPELLKIGDIIVSSNKCIQKVGNALPLKNIAIGLDIHNIELFPKKGGQLIRAAGTSAKIISKNKNLIGVLLSSKEFRFFHSNCFGTIGRLSNNENYLIKYGKAGRKRWLGVRPTVRGSAMNPNDHPHGGGEGRCPIGKKFPVTPWGKPALGVKTRLPKKLSSKFIVKTNK